MNEWGVFSSLCISPVCKAPLSVLTFYLLKCAASWRGAVNTIYFFALPSHLVCLVWGRERRGVCSDLAASWRNEKMKPFSESTAHLKHHKSLPVCDWWLKTVGVFGNYVWRTSSSLSAFHCSLCLMRIIADLEGNHLPQASGLVCWSRWVRYKSPEKTNQWFNFRQQGVEGVSETLK